MAKRPERLYIYNVGGLQSDYYCEKYPDPNERPKHLSATVFKMKLIHEMWIMFQVIWNNETISWKLSQRS